MASTQSHELNLSAVMGAGSSGTPGRRHGRAREIRDRRDERDQMKCFACGEELSSPASRFCDSCRREFAATGEINRIDIANRVATLAEECSIRLSSIISRAFAG